MKVAAVRETLEKALLELNPNNTWPVNVHAILSRLGIHLRFDGSKGKTASYLELGHPPTIVICEPTPALFLSSRERFSIAHELAHWVVWRRFGSVPSSESEYWFHETLCNEFAAGLLVPYHGLMRFLRKQSEEKVHPVHFPTKIVQLAAVSWEVAAKSIAACPSADSAYLRLGKARGVISKSTSTDTNELVPLRVNCSTLTNMPGSYVGRSALLRDQVELLKWMNLLAKKRSESRRVTVTLGGLHLNDVPCTILRETDYWIVHFRRSSGGIEIDESLHGDKASRATA